MINHEHKLIFIHIPKCAGSSINKFYFENKQIDWRVPNYEVLYGWCPKRKIHLQHATTKQLLETELISEEKWDDYFKFTFVRNPWDRMYSSYLWVMQDRNVKGSFKEYVEKRGVFKNIVNTARGKTNRGVHLLRQVDFLDLNGKFQVDFIGQFEKFNEDIIRLNKMLQFQNKFNIHEKKNTARMKHYSLFFTNSNKELVSDLYSEDATQFRYNFEDKRNGLCYLKRFF